MLIQSLRPQTFSQVVGNKLNNKILMALAKDPTKGPSTIILQGTFGSGKAIDSNSILPTPNGNRQASEISVGDFLFDRHGQPTQVTGVYPQGLKDSYKVQFEDGRIVYCNDEHLWTYIDRRTQALVTKTLREIIDRELQVEIPMNNPVVYPSRVLPYTPYTIGLLLCHSEVDDLTVQYRDKQTLGLLKQLTPQIDWQFFLNWSYNVPKSKSGSLITKSEFYGSLLSSMENYTIPDLYLYSSIPQRWELLQSIMDCCGTVSNDNNVFCELPYKTLKDSFVQLVNSLGLSVSVMEGVNKYILYFKANNRSVKSLFKNKQIPTLIYNSHIETDRLVITSITKEDSQRDMICFMVDNPEHLYLCNDFIVTHNTTSSRLFAKALNCKHLKENDICGECPICKADLNNVPWYTEFDSSAINVDSIRDMRDVFMTTAKGFNKVVVIDETHLLSKTAQSALLKLFEETPKGLFFILATTDPDKLLPTIRSRSLELIYTVKSAKEVKEDIAKHAKELGINISTQALDLIATRSRGVMRNAHMMLDKLNLLGEEEFLKSDVPTTNLLNDFIASILKTDRSLVLETVSELSRIPVAYLRDDWQDYFLNLMKASIDPTLVQDERIKKFASLLNKQQLGSVVRFCIQDWVIKSFQNSTQAQTALLAIYQMLSREPK